MTLQFVKNNIKLVDNRRRFFSLSLVEIVMKSIKEGHHEHSVPAFQMGKYKPQLEGPLRTMVGLKVLSFSKSNLS